MKRVDYLCVLLLPFGSSHTASDQATRLRDSNVNESGIFTQGLTIRDFEKIAKQQQGRKDDDDNDVYQFLDGIWSITTNAGGKRNATTQPFGYSNIPQKIPLSKDSRFPITSNSKFYTAVAIYQLYEQGKLDVDADIATMLEAQDFTNFGISNPPRKFCPRLAINDWWRRCETITLRHLLSMSSGIYPGLNCNANPTTPTQCNPAQYYINPGSIGRTLGTFILEPLIFKPGTEYHYSNPNFVLATYFVEKCSGMTFRNYLEEHILSKIGLENTYYDFFNAALRLDPKRVDQYARYYNNSTDPPQLMSVGKEILQLDLGVAAGTGGVISTAEDYATFWYALFNKSAKGDKLISDAR